MFNSYSSWCTTSCCGGCPTFMRATSTAPPPSGGGEWRWEAGRSSLLSSSFRQYSSYNDQELCDNRPFDGVDSNTVKRQSYRGRRFSSSNSENSSNSRDGTDSVASDRYVKPAARRKTTNLTSAVPSPTLLVINQQPKSEAIHRPDLGDKDGRNAGQKTALLRSVSGNVEKGDNKQKNAYRKTSQATRTFLLTPNEASYSVYERPFDQQDALPRATSMTNIPASNKVRKEIHFSTPNLLKNGDTSSSDESTQTTKKKTKNVNTPEDSKTIQKTSHWKRAWNVSIGRNHQFEFKGSDKTVPIRSVTSAQNIAAKKSVVQQGYAQYTFGLVTIYYKFSKEEILGVDVLSITDVPKYLSYADDAPDSFEVRGTPLTYVDVEVTLKLPKTKDQSFKMKRFRTGEVEANTFEPEWHTFKSKDFGGAQLIVSVSRRHRSHSPHYCLGHAIFKPPLHQVKTVDIYNEILTLRHGTQHQYVQGSVLVVLKCDKPDSRGDCNLSLDVKLVQHLNIETLMNVNKKNKLEMKLRLQLLNVKQSSKLPLNTVQESPWIGLKDNSLFNRRQEDMEELNKKTTKQDPVNQRPITVGGWGALIPAGHTLRRVVANSDLKDFNLFFLLQVWGRRESSLTSKEVLIGSVILGPETRCSTTAATSKGLEDSYLTHWGRALSKREPVEMYHRLHL